MNATFEAVWGKKPFRTGEETAPVLKGVDFSVKEAINDE
ncbi:hypothetical protein SAMN05421736_11194 [Evansella caseinilytica]|uniref:Uncharacterized protein n=1 Tax=Evansella caseinilytica TaxID=1503961 RepID=A0A1H3SKX4_9BACI|nr:hypothetical protein SAMN05421736_11194 [Evansella caseinilytica]